MMGGSFHRHAGAACSWIKRLKSCLRTIGAGGFVPRARNPDLNSLDKFRQILNKDSSPMFWVTLSRVTCRSKFFRGSGLQGREYGDAETSLSLICKSV
jgi:hypothetical protein